VNNLRRWMLDGAHAVTSDEIRRLLRVVARA
jgi:hypothetical protein